MEQKNYIRITHPETGDFICEYYPETREIVSTKHKKTATISLDEKDREYAATKTA